MENPAEPFLTVSEFASRSHRSRKRIYDLMQGKLAAYCKTIDGKKMIAEAGLYLFDDSVKVTAQNCKGDKKSCKGDSSEAVKVTTQENADNTHIPENEVVKVTNQSCKGDKPDSVKVTSENCQGDNTLTTVIMTLREQLTAKDKQIEQQGSQIAELTAALRTAQAQAESLTAALTAAQALHAGSLQRIGEKASPEPVRAEAAPEAAAAPPRPSQDPPKPPRSSPKQKTESPRSGSQHKPGLFARLFRRERK